MKKLLVTSFVKEELLAAAGCTSVSSATLDWLQAETEKLVAYVAAQGKKTSGGKLQPPAVGYLAAQEESRAGPGAKDFPEKVCWRAKEWRTMSAEDKDRKLTETFVAWFALSTGEKMDVLSRIYIAPVAEAQQPDDSPAEREEHGAQDEVPKGRGRRASAGKDDLSAL